MNAQLPHIVIECANSNRAALDVPEHDSFDHSCLSPFTNDLSMWSPNSSCHGSSYLGSQTDSIPNDVNYQESPTSQLQPPEQCNTLRPANRQRYGNNISAEQGYATKELPFPVKISSTIGSDYGYAHQHSDSVVSCILCGLEAYRRFQHKMGWPYYTEYPDFESFDMALPQPDSPKCTTIYPNLTTEDEWLQVFSKWKGDDTNLKRISTSIYSSNASNLPLLDEKSPDARKTYFWERIGKCMSYCISQLRNDWR
jgi:hypothetical protein